MEPADNDWFLNEIIIINGSGDAAANGSYYKETRTRKNSPLAMDDNLVLP